MKKQTAGRDALGSFAPKFAELNDDVLFGQIWSRGELMPRDRSLVTVSALIAGGNFEQLAHHLNFAKANGVSKKEIVETITHLAFYAGWPKAWSAFNLAKTIFADDEAEKVQTPFPKGELITNGLFKGDTYLFMMVLPQDGHGTAVANVTFTKGARNNWHSHKIGQFLLATAGEGFYQEYGKPAQYLKPGDVVNIPGTVKHWHGAAPESEFVHIAVTPGETDWFEAVSDADYEEATKNV
jgi:alkylhydroperoxidase/carboxymuconolactone decarboxylase family protein YurZ